MSIYSEEVMDDYREPNPHASEVPRDTSVIYPDIYINGPEVGLPTTVDPYKNQHWLRDDSDAWKKIATHVRGAIKNHAGVTAVEHLLDNHPPPPTAHEYLSSQIDALDKLTPRCVANSTRGKPGAKTERYGQLPEISAQIYKNALPNRVDYAAWQDMWLENTHGSRDRSFDCRGMCR